MTSPSWRLNLESMRGLGFVVAAVLSGGCASALNSRAADWPRWRGPGLDGVAPSAPILLPWGPGEPRQVWRAAVGTGFSSVAVSSGRAFTLGNRDGNDTVYCFDAQSGRVLWSHTYACALDPNLYEGGPSATPAVDGDVVYTLSKFAHLYCFKAAGGEIVWQRHLTVDFGIEKPEWGFGGSPVVEGSMLLVSAGGHGLALNKASGAVVWMSNTLRAGYSTLVPFDLDGSRAAVMLSYTNAAAVSLRDGRLLWQVFWRSSFDMNCPDPIVYGGRIFLTSVSKSGRMVLAGTGAFDPAYPLINLKTHLSPGVVVDHHLYAFHGDAERPGQLACVDLRNGAVRWASALDIGALIAAGNKLIIVSGSGELILAEASPAAFQPISRAQILAGRCWTPPALAGDQLFVRGAAGDVLSLRLPAQAPPELRIESAPPDVILSWPVEPAGYRLESKDKLGSPDPWVGVADPSVAVDGRSNVAVRASATNQFFRLRKP